MTYKQCSACQETKLITEFFKLNHHTDKYYSECKLCTKKRQKLISERHKERNSSLSKEELFRGTKICPKCKNKLPKNLFHKNISRPDGVSSHCRICFAKNPLNVYTRISANAKSREMTVLKRSDFLDWFKEQEKECVYCGITEEILNKYPIFNTRSNIYIRLTIDRKDNEKGYTRDNIVLACDDCNRRKYDWLPFDEMIHLAQKYLVPRWKLLIEK